MTKNSDYTNLDVSRLENGKSYSYAEICELIGIPMATHGKARINQMKNIRRYLEMEYNHKTNLWQIVEIYDYPIPKHANGNSKYIEYIECLFLNRLMSLDMNCCVATKNQLYGWLYMVNSKYTELAEQRDNHNRNTNRKMIDAELGDINPMRKNTDLSTLGDIFVYRTRKTLSEILTEALKSMADRHVITYRYETVIVEQNENSLDNEEFGKTFENAQPKQKDLITHVASIAEEHKVDDVKATILKKMHFSKESEVVKHNRSVEFYQRVNKELYDRYRWVAAYKQYRIMFTPDIVNSVLNSMYLKLDSDFDKAIIENGKMLNTLLVEKMSTPEYFTNKTCKAQPLLSSRDIAALINMVHTKVEIKDFKKEGHGKVKFENINIYESEAPQ